MSPLEGRTLLSGAAPEPLSAVSGAPLTASVTPAQLMPLSSVPLLSSHPSSTVKIYLDFAGAPAQPWGGFATTTTPAYDTDGDATSFSDTEIAQIQEIWSRVSEKYSPFDVNVTTVDPGPYPYFKVARMVIGGDGAWSGGVYGGYSYQSGFSGVTSNTSWIFTKNLGKGKPKYVAEAAAHEAGHLFGLSHQSAYDALGNKTDEYRGGRDVNAPNPADPIMGFSYYATRGVWSSGPSSLGAGQFQSDLDIIAGSANGFGYRPDDHGNQGATADALQVLDGVHASGAGVIEQATDVDYFKFNSTGGLVDLSADVAPFGPMLDLALSLSDASGNLLASADTLALGERVSAIVPAGDYYLAVSSHGGYGDVGQYTISGSVVPEPAAVAVLLLGVGALTQCRSDRARRAVDPSV